MNLSIAMILTSFLLMLPACSTQKIMAKVSKPGSPEVAKNIIYVIVDGMGYEHVKASRIYNGQQPLSYEQFPCKTSVTTCSIAGADKSGHCLAHTDDVTDSAAAATAIATGAKVKNGAISRKLPAEEADVQTILEIAKSQGKSTGIIATKLFTDATPAAFASHANDRDETEEILKDMFTASTPNVVFGADTPLHRSYAKKSIVPYTFVHNAIDLARTASTIESKTSCVGTDCPFVYGGFGEYEMIPGVFNKKAGLPLEITDTKSYAQQGLPHLSQMTDAALKILNKNQNGFFLMVESSMPDMISHYNKQIDKLEHAPKAINVLIEEMNELNKTVKVLEAFVANNPNTLVVVTADHETGGLVIEEDKTSCLGKQGCVPSVRWTAASYDESLDSPARHTNANVPLYAAGVGADRFCKETINNIDIHSLSLAQ